MCNRKVKYFMDSKLLQISCFKIINILNYLMAHCCCGCVYLNDLWRLNNLVKYWWLTFQFKLLTYSLKHYTGGHSPGMNVKFKIPQRSWDFTLLSATQKSFILFYFALHFWLELKPKHHIHSTWTIKTKA